MYLDQINCLTELNIKKETNKKKPQRIINGVRE